MPAGGHGRPVVAVLPWPSAGPALELDAAI